MKNRFLFSIAFLIVIAICISLNVKVEHGYVFISKEYVLYSTEGQNVSLDSLNFSDTNPKWKWINNYRKITHNDDLAYKCNNACLKKVKIVYAIFPLEININNVYYKQIYIFKITTI